jgi:protein PhnA
MSFDEVESTVVTKDSNGNVLKAGHSVVVIKDLDVKGAKTTIKRGNTYENIRTTSSAEEIAVREGKQVWVLNTCFVKKG